MRLAKILAVSALTACAPSAHVPAPTADVAMNRPTEPGVPRGLASGQPQGLVATAPLQISRSNAEIAQDFLDLEFRMESGRPLPMMTRFEGPIRVAMTGKVPPTAQGDLTRLLSRFRSEAGIDIRQADGPAQITVEFVPRSTIRKTYANVACFVAPRVSSWEEYKSARGTGQLDWATLTRRDRVAIFAPADASPQEVRDCLHEEMAQALGPLNDLYQLSDSVFNDDNFHTVLTGFDMLVLRLHYSPGLRNGMTRDEVAAALPGLLARMNPGGAGGGATHDGGRTPQAWIRAMETALGGGGTGSARKAAAQQALAIASAQGWNDTRLAFSWFAVGRLNIGADPVAAANAFGEAARIYRRLPGARIHAAHVDMQLAALALSQGRADQALAFTERALPVARQAQNASLLATLSFLKAEVLEAQGDARAAAALRLDTQGVARYGFGSDAVTRARLRDIAALMPSKLRLALGG
ncbi:DUF2927 domain-containing protein [Gemmobacter denitrificans]|uniref:DUF2927 domain-containing protein n=1 Tax=Gemmobacter denitrificans TaxID=3123040 RepID=A0ABU8BPB0_9RHOB